jgi:hypothetical protein
MHRENSVEWYGEVYIIKRYILGIQKSSDLTEYRALSVEWK